VIPVNKQLQAVLANPGNVIENASLLLDKYHTDCLDQQGQKPELRRVTAIAPKDAELGRRLHQYRVALDVLGATRWTSTTLRSPDLVPVVFAGEGKRNEPEK
jgi:hypothetical protein